METLRLFARFMIGTLLLSIGGLNVMHGATYMVTHPGDDWLWFSRFAFGMILFGLYYAGKREK